MNVKSKLMLAALATALTASFGAYAADDAAKMPAATDGTAQAEAPMKNKHNHECDAKGRNCGATSSTKPAKPAPKIKNAHNHECEMKHTGCQDPTAK